jgi:hypothetical protein
VVTNSFALFDFDNLSGEKFLNTLTAHGSPGTLFDGASKRD